MQYRKRIFTTTLALLFCVSTVVITNNADAQTTRDKLMSIRQQKNSVLNTLAAGNATLQNYQNQMKLSQQKIDALQQQVDKVSLLKQAAEAKEAVVQKKFDARLRSLYEQGEMGYMAVLLQSKSFAEFLSRFEYVRLVAQQDYALVQERQQATDDVQKQIDALNKLIADQEKEVQKSQTAFNQMIAQMKKSKDKLKQLQGMEDENENELIDINKGLIASGKLKFPFTGPIHRPMNVHITSPFGERWGRMHEGVDFGTQGKIGVPYYAAADGVVVESRVSSGYGWLITIYHGQYNGLPFYTRYAHSYPYEVKVKVGQEVHQGEQISSVGNNGHSTGPHLHFEVRIGNGARPPAYDPMKFFAN